MALWPVTADAQLAPTGAHYAGRATDTGHSGPSDSGGYATSIPLDVPPSRGGLPVPIQIVSGTRGFGAAGLGWDVPLSFVQVHSSFGRRRPAVTPGSPIAPRVRISVSLPGRSAEMIQRQGEWVGRTAPDLRLVANGDTWTVFDGNGLTYSFSQDPHLFGTGLWLLDSITGPGGARVALTYNLASVDVGAVEPAVSIDLMRVSYNPHPGDAGCFKNDVELVYAIPFDAKPQAFSMLGARVRVRDHRLIAVDVRSRAVCAGTAVRLRRYRFDYELDADTRQERLASVKLLGRSGTPEASVPLPVAEYDYGAATSPSQAGRVLRFDSVGTPAVDVPEVGDAVARTAELTASEFDASVLYTLPGVGIPWPPGLSDLTRPKLYGSRQSFIDVTGDGRPDIVYQAAGTLWVARGQAAPDGSMSFASPAAFNDSTFTRPVLDVRTSAYGRFERDAVTGHNVETIWTQTLDVNGDGRLDIIDAAEQADHWIVYLNTPGANASGIEWVRRAYHIGALYSEFEQRFLIAGYQGYLPLSRRHTGIDHGRWMCWRWDFDEGEYVADPDNLNNVSECFVGNRSLSPFAKEKTFVEWEVRDLNGDGYPDVVFNSSPVGFIDGAPPPPGPVGNPSFVLGERWTRLQPLGPSRVEAVFNVAGLAIYDVSAATNPFSAPKVLATDDTYTDIDGVAHCGIGLWWSLPDDTRTFAKCGIGEVNGDGIADYVRGTTATLGSGAAFNGPALTLPNHLGVQANNYKQECVDLRRTNYQARTVSALRDVTGDGVPDLIEEAPPSSGTLLRVHVGTGAGFTAPIAVQGSVEISHSDESCSPHEKTSRTVTGMYDVDGDGKPDRLKLENHGGSTGWVYRVDPLVGGTVPGNPEAGRLVRISNGHGGDTNIRYVSAKRDGSTTHQVPFPEIVVASIQTTGTQGLGGSTTPTHYAYGNIGLFYDPIVDAFRPTGYLRRVETIVTSGAGYPMRQVTAKVTDRYPFEAVTLPSLVTMTGGQRFGRYLRAGRVRDVTILAGDLSADPWAHLTVSLRTGADQIAGVRYDVNLEDARLIADTASQSDDHCVDVVYPYDFERSKNTQFNTDFDPCSARGLLFTRGISSWRGAAPPPSSDNVQVRTTVLDVDDFGRVTSTFHQNDAARTDDDVCVDVRYAGSIFTGARVLTAIASRRVWSCPRSDGPEVTYAEEAWEYDKLFGGLVLHGFVTAHTTYRHAADTGAWLSTVRDYDVDYDVSGNPIEVLKVREDGATNATVIEYDGFGLVPVRTTVSGTDVPTLSTVQTFDPLTNEVLTSTDENGTIRGATFDGFARPLLSTIDTPDAAPGVLVSRSYLGFEGGHASGRHLVVKEFTDAVPATEVAMREGRTSTTYLDELGRARFARVGLGADYGSEALIVGARQYDGLGRVAFEADPYAASQDATTAYGTTRYFEQDGSLRLAIRGRGHQPFSTEPDPAVERYPSVFWHSFSNHREVFAAQGPDARSPSTPQYGTTRETSVTAVGRVVSRSTWTSQDRAEYAELSYDHLGNQTQMIRYRDALAPSEPVTWSWRFDSVGQLLELAEPASAPQQRIYSDWGELKQVSWAPLANPPHSIVRTYDAFGRLTHVEEQSGDQTDPATVNDYRYDIAAAPSSVEFQNVLGRLASATSPTGTVAFGYDGHGNVDARSHMDADGTAYVERHGFHGDGSQAWIELGLPDNKYRPERLDYEYDSAGRLRWMWFSDGSNTQELYNASEIDPLGRLRAATFGRVTEYSAAFDDVGRRLPKNVKVWSGAETRDIFFTGFDAVGRELSREERLPNFSGNQTVAYDPIGRIQRSTRTHVGNGQAMAQWTFEHDALGNVTALDDHLGTAGARLSYQTADRDRICQIDYGDGVSGTGCDVEYDTFGNITYQPTRAGHRKLAYFNFGGVRSLENVSAAGATTTSFRYDPFGRVQERDVKIGDQLLQSDRHYGALLTRRSLRTPSAKPNQAGPKADIEYVERRFPGPGLEISRRGARGPWIFQFSEPRGARFTADEDGNFIQDLDFTPYGEATSTGAVATDVTYTTQQWNGGETAGGFGLVHLGARLYDPVIGRFLSRDPLLIPRTSASSNPYAFAFNDPLNFSDPTGLDGCAENPECAAGIAATLGASAAIFYHLFGSGSGPPENATPGERHAYYSAYVGQLDNLRAYESLGLQQELDAVNAAFDLLEVGGASFGLAPVLVSPLRQGYTESYIATRGWSFGKQVAYLGLQAPVVGNFFTAGAELRAKNLGSGLFHLAVGVAEVALAEIGVRLGSRPSISSGMGGGGGGGAGFAGRLRALGGRLWESAAGLRYGPGSAQGNRVRHVLEHAVDIPGRAGSHGVFAGGRKSVIGTIDEAYVLARAGGPAVSVVEQGARTVYTVNMGRSVGFVGGEAGAALGYPTASHVRLVLEGKNVITAFPVIP